MGQNASCFESCILQCADIGAHQTSLHSFESPMLSCRSTGSTCGAFVFFLILGDLGQIMVRFTKGSHPRIVLWFRIQTLKTCDECVSVSLPAAQLHSHYPLRMGFLDFWPRRRERRHAVKVVRLSEDIILSANAFGSPNL